MDDELFAMFYLFYHVFVVFNKYPVVSNKHSSRICSSNFSLDNFKLSGQWRSRERLLYAVTI